MLAKCRGQGVVSVSLSRVAKVQSKKNKCEIADPGKVVVRKQRNTRTNKTMDWAIDSAATRREILVN